MPAASPDISVIVPVRDEETSIRRLLQALVTQTYPPAEIVIADGGSTDQTTSIIRTFQVNSPVRIQLIESDDALPGRARNLAIASAANDWLACIDAGIEPACDWLAQLVAGMRREPDAWVVYGRLVPARDTYFTACASIVYVPTGPRVRWLPSCLLHRAAWATAGRFREDLRSAEDLLFFRALDRADVCQAYSDAAVVIWQLRPDTRQTFRRFALYSRNNMTAGLWRDWQSPVLRLYAALAASALAGLWLPPLALLPPLIVVVRAQRRIWQWFRATAPHRLWREVVDPRRALTVAWISVVIDLATFCGLWQWAVHDRWTGSRAPGAS